MASKTTTPEQKAVIEHPIGQHARVLAVAGSGKTTTMALRVRYLVNRCGVDPHRICVLMFNKQIQTDFAAKLDIMAINSRIVRTFHSYAHGIVNDAIDRNLLPVIDNPWLGENSEEARRLVLKLIRQAERKRRIPYNSLDAEQVLTAIELWKSALIPPENAGHHTNEALVDLYAAFEEERLAQNAYTFSDMIPMAIRLLETEPAMQQRWQNQYDFVIVDEYQDVNHGQQKLIELLAGKRADVMVVGDDDQTIYEWRGARPDYLIEIVKSDFNNKPIVDYTLSHSFRFGPLVAQCAQNVMQHNLVRVEKPVIAHAVRKPAEITVLEGEPNALQTVNDQLADIAQRAYRKGEQVIVLGRLYSQMIGFELSLLTRKQPYRVEGGEPLPKRREVRQLLNYIRLAKGFDRRLTRQASEWFLSTVNVPNRKLRRDTLEAAVNEGYAAELTVREFFSALVKAQTSPFQGNPRQWFEGYANVIMRLALRLERPAGEVLLNLVTDIEFDDHFDNYYGRSDTAEDHKQAVAALCRYALSSELSALAFLDHMDALDPGQHAPPEAQLTLTSVHRVKGLEYDTVIIPDCLMGTMPCLIDADLGIYDTTGTVPETEPSAHLDSERRLFYVALTRARHRVFIGGVRPLSNQERAENAPEASLFLGELALQDTSTAVQMLQQKPPETVRDYLREMPTTPHRYSLTQNVVAHYFPAMEVELEREQLAFWLSHTDPPRIVKHVIDPKRGQKPESKPYNRDRKRRLQQYGLSPTDTVQDAFTADLNRVFAIHPYQVIDAREGSSRHENITRHPRAYQKWSKEEEEIMLRMLAQGFSRKQVSRRLQRQMVSIKMRLEKIEEQGRI